MGRDALEDTSSSSSFFFLFASAAVREGEMGEGKESEDSDR